MKMKDTLNLGKTKFKMRGNLPVREAEWQKEWEEADVYHQRQKINENKPSFILHDGPPYANGDIHMGHALNKISKDIIIRQKSMSGYRAPYVPGWDTHGLPIEQAVTNSGVDRKKLTVAAFRKICEEYAWKQVNKQREDFKRLGVAGEWDHPYVTLDPVYEEQQIRLFGKMAEKGYIYKGLKPIYWSPSSESSLAEAEIEYKDVKSPSIYVAFDVVDGKGKLDDATSFIIWTTTPWTLPSNLAITVHPDFDYVLVKAGEKKYVVARDLLSNVSSELGWDEVEVLDEFKGKDLEYMTAQHPFYDRTSMLILGDHVTLDAGTGLVHTAPGHGEDDYMVGKKYHLEPLSPIDDKGCFTTEAPGLEGMYYDKANKVITEWLEKNGQLLKLSFFTHSYPHDWRTKKPVIFRATPQWFASIDQFRQEILDVIEQDVKWWHPSGKTRIYNMVRDRGDWVISRQRVWGVPLPIFYAENGEPIITPETINHVATLVGEHGSNVWFEREAKDLLPEGFTHPGSPNQQFTKETDIMDVWFDSGSSHAGVLRTRPELSFPADMYLEGSDQYRGWFNSSLTTSVAVNDQAPYKNVLSQGFVMDGEGKKMSKSLGNTILPEKVIKQMGADIIRLWTASVDYEYDVRVSTEILQQISESYRKIRNTIRFLLANTSDFDPKQHSVAFEDLNGLDQYMTIRFNQIVKKIREDYEAYDFSSIYQTVMNFVTVDLSQFYLDIAKDIVYIDAPNGHDRRAMQTVFYDIAVKLTKLLTPILPHTCEEVWNYLTEEEAFVQLSEFPEVENFEHQDEILADWRTFMETRDKVLKALEVARNEKIIGKSFEAEVTLYPTSSVKENLEKLGANIGQLLIVSDLKIADPTQTPDSAMKFDDLAVEVTHAHGETCERCRIISEEVGTFEDAPTICGRCHAILEEHYPEALTAEME
ncbi:isoleucine--tRNA ligase [Pisciglobus halotolerans]|uniref:Isoleucine--tRNA ligase n=1 Tax=Pisciglobus halotolerans TaxID=745365 RepID=A0A1I3BW13_9LACT|nr:isoleucine--tRNA ligase [Pisciglobus halotolerans]SFH66487.1 Isoleucyl-tRNA synthetase [Pisciglobus halotolerans]